MNLASMRRVLKIKFLASGRNTQRHILIPIKLINIIPDPMMHKPRLKAASLLNIIQGVNRKQIIADSKDLGVRVETD